MITIQNRPSVANDFLQHEEAGGEQDAVRDPHGPPGLDGAGLTEIQHEKHDWIVDHQNGKKAHDEAGDELAACLQHGEGPPTKAKNRQLAAMANRL